MSAPGIVFIVAFSISLLLTRTLVDVTFGSSIETSRKSLKGEVILAAFAGVLAAGIVAFALRVAS